MSAVHNLLKQNHCLTKGSCTIFITFTSPKASQVKYIHVYLRLAALYINTDVSFKSNVTKIKIIADLLFSILFNFRNEHLYFGTPHSIILMCDMCYNARKIKSFPRYWQSNKKSENFRISHGKCNSFKELRGRWHIPAYSPKLNMFHWQNIVSRYYDNQI